LIQFLISSKFEISYAFKLTSNSHFIQINIHNPKLTCIQIIIHNHHAFKLTSNFDSIAYLIQISNLIQITIHSTHSNLSSHPNFKSLTFSGRQQGTGWRVTGGCQGQRGRWYLTRQPGLRSAQGPTLRGRWLRRRPTRWPRAASGSSARTVAASRGGE
jgi:hypothetical protein